MLKPRGSKTGIEILLGTHPTLTDYSIGKTVGLVKQIGEDEATQLLVVLKDGSTQRINFCGELPGSIVYHLPARHEELDEDVNRLLASDIKAIRLESRPIEWITFDQIPLNHL